MNASSLVVAANYFACRLRRERAKCRMLDAIGEKADRAICQRKTHAARVVAAETADDRPAGTQARIDGAGTVDAATGGFPVKIQLHSGNCPIAIARPGGAISVFR